MANFFSEKLRNAETSYTFDGVLLRPNHSSVEREQISLKSKITKSVNLKIPFISSPMDTVTTASMATEMAKQGGIGIIHRNMSSENQIKEIQKL